MSNLALEIFMKERAGTLLRTKVGDRYVMEAMRKTGAMLGGVLLGVIESFSQAYISTQLSDAIVFGVLILVLLVRPAGLLGRKKIEKV